MTRVIIVEDENLAAQKLVRQLKNIEPDIEIMDILDSVTTATYFLKRHKVDLIFLDIHLGDDLSFRIFEKVKIKTPIIFTTAYDQYAIKAFKLNSIDYLLKPISKTDLQGAMLKYHENQTTVMPPIDYQALWQSLQDDQTVYQKRFMVYVGDKVKTIDAREVAYFFAEGKHVYLVDTNGREYLIDYTLDKLLERLDPERYFRINRQFIIQIAAISEMIAYSKGRLKIVLEPAPKKETIVSIDRAAAFKNWLNR